MTRCHWHASEWHEPITDAWGLRDWRYRSATKFRRTLGEWIADQWHAMRGR